MSATEKREQAAKAYEAAAKALYEATAFSGSGLMPNHMQSQCRQLADWLNDQTGPLRGEDPAIVVRLGQANRISRSKRAVA